MKVEVAVAGLIRAWPSLYQTRGDALKHLFNCYQWEWCQGELRTEYPEELDNTFDSRSVPATDHGGRTQISDAIEQSRRQAIETWTSNNAQLLAKDERVQFTNDCLCLMYSRFADMPEDVTDEWRQAAYEAASALYWMTKDAKEGTHEHTAHRELRAFLVEHGLIKRDDPQVKARIEALRAELAKLEG